MFLPWWTSHCRQGNIFPKERSFLTPHLAAFVAPETHALQNGIGSDQNRATCRQYNTAIGKLKLRKTQRCENRGETDGRDLGGHTLRRGLIWGYISFKISARRRQNHWPFRSGCSRSSGGASHAGARMSTSSAAGGPASGPVVPHHHITRRTRCREGGLGLPELAADGEQRRAPAGRQHSNSKRQQDGSPRRRGKPYPSSQQPP